MKEILGKAYNIPTGEHFGTNKTLGKIRKRFYWATCKHDVEDWCTSCRVCMAEMGPSSKRSALQIYNVGAPFKKIKVDILKPLPVSHVEIKYLLMVIDCFTKWPEAIPIKNKRATTVAKSLVRQMFSRHGVPLELHTDQRKNFESRLRPCIFNRMGKLRGNIRRS